MRSNKISNTTSLNKSKSNEAMPINTNDFSSSGILNTDEEETALQLKKQSASKSFKNKKKLALRGNSTVMVPHDT